jgi:hypothetical protein
MSQDVGAYRQIKRSPPTDDTSLFSTDRYVIAYEEDADVTT